MSELAGKTPRGFEERLIADDLAFRACKQMQQSCYDPDSLGDLDRAALRWWKVNPRNRENWGDFGELVRKTTAKHNQEPVPH